MLDSDWQWIIKRRNHDESLIKDRQGEMGSKVKSVQTEDWLEENFYIKKLKELNNLLSHRLVNQTYLQITGNFFKGWR